MSLLMLLTVAALATDAPATERSAKPVAAMPAKTVSGQTQAEPLTEVSVRLACTASPQGRVSGCVVLEESRPGLGFGRAALALMEGAEVAPDPGAGAPVRFERTIQFMP